MPLVVPGITSSGSSKGGSGGSGNDWMNKLMGKTLGDNHNETTFAKKDLPGNHRLVDSEGGMMSMDHQPERYVLFCYVPFRFESSGEMRCERRVDCCVIG